MPIKIDYYEPVYIATMIQLLRRTLVRSVTLFSNRQASLANSTITLAHRKIPVKNKECQLFILLFLYKPV